MMRKHGSRTARTALAVALAVGLAPVPAIAQDAVGADGHDLQPIELGQDAQASMDFLSELQSIDVTSLEGSQPTGDDEAQLCDLLNSAAASNDTQLVAMDTADDEGIAAQSNGADAEVNLTNGYSSSTFLEKGHGMTGHFTITADSMVYIVIGHTSTNGFSDIGTITSLTNDDTGARIDVFPTLMYDTSHNYGTFCLPAGSYTIEARAFKDMGIFSLGYAATAVNQKQGIEQERNDDTTEASRIEPNFLHIGSSYRAVVDDRDHMNDRADPDYWEFTLYRSQKVVLALYSNNNTVAALYDENDNLVGYNGSGSGIIGSTRYNGQLVLDCGTLPAGTYRIAVMGIDSGSWGDIYGLAVTIPNYYQPSYCPYVEGKAFTRLAGDEAAETSSDVSQEAFDGGKSEWVVLARDDDFADAMSATGLAGTLKAPIVLTDRNSLSSSAVEAIQAVGASRALIIGGRGAIPGDLESQLANIGVTVDQRVYGNEAPDTSVACADLIKKHGGNENGDAIVAMSTNFQDALSISSFAYRYGVPIFLEQGESEGRELPWESVERIKQLSGTIFVPGGPGAVPTQTVEDVFGSGCVQRLYGYDGYDTSNQIATWMVSHGYLTADMVVLACGAPSPKGLDALSGSALAGINGGVVLLVNGNRDLGWYRSVTVRAWDSQGTRAFLRSYGEQVQRAYLVGGTYVMPYCTAADVADVLGS